MYNSDIGFGFGAKGVVRNQFGNNESFDLILFGSSKGEQLYSFAFSIPDFELRQGTDYAVAFDVKLEYNKLLKSNFFGFGNATSDNEFQFPIEKSLLEITLSRTFAPRIIGEARLRQGHTSVFDFDPSWGTITTATPGAGETSVTAGSLRLRFDSRDSRIHPRKGMKFEVIGETCFPVFTKLWDFSTIRLEMSGYTRLFSKNHILALRCWMQQVCGDAPYYEMSRIGGGGTVRGYKVDRFADRAMTLGSLEYRFPLFRKLGGVLFVDSGRVFPSLSGFTIQRFHTNTGLGLRYYLTTFIVRFDMGLSSEGTRIFFNFGHVF